MASSINWGAINKVLGSKGFEVGAGLAGAGLQAASAASQRKQDREFQQQQLAQSNANSLANRQQSAAQNRTNVLMQLLQQEQNRRDQASRDVAAASPLGEFENFAGRQAFLRAIAPQLRNFSVTPTDPGVAAAMPKLSGGIRLPEGGLPAEAFAHLSPEATAAAIGRRQKQLSSIDTSTPIVDLQALGIDPKVAEAQSQDVNAYIADLITQRQDGDDRMKAQIMAALDADDAREQAEAAKANSVAAEDGTMPNPDGTPPKGYEFDKKTGRLKKKGSGFWKKLGKAAIIGGAAVATGLTAGAASPALAAAIGAGAGAATGAMDGGWKGALMGAGLGAATGGLAGGAGGSVAGSTVPKVIQNALINPRTLTAMGGQFVPGAAGTALQLGSSFLPGAPQAGYRADVDAVNRRVAQSARRFS